MTQSKTNVKSNWLLNTGKIIYYIIWFKVFLFFLAMTIFTWMSNLILITMKAPEVGPSMVALSKLIGVWLNVIIILLNIAIGYIIIKILKKFK